MCIKIRKIIIFCSCLFMILLVTGCGLKKEVLLEYADSSNSEISASNEDTSNRDSSTTTTSDVIDGQITTEETVISGSKNTTDPPDDQIYVYICGQVVNPGVYQVNVGERIFTVIEMAGGLTQEANEAGVNQAQTLVDGQMIYIPAVGEEVSSVMTATANTGQTNEQSGKVNINTATLEELMTLTGIGEGKAQSILNYRQEHGSFQSTEELMNVDGIKEGTYSKLKDEITI